MEDVSRLTALGEAQAAELGRAIAQLGERIDRVFISPLARARHTFDHMEKQWRAVGFKAYPRCAPTFVPEIQGLYLVGKIDRRTHPKPNPQPTHPCLPTTIHRNLPVHVARQPARGPAKTLPGGVRQLDVQPRRVPGG